MSQSLVLVRADEPTAFRTLDRIWELMGDAAAFRDYVRSETARFLQHERAT